MQNSRCRLVLSCLGCVVLGGALGFGMARLFPPENGDGGGRAYRDGRTAGATGTNAAQNGQTGAAAQKNNPLENTATDKLRSRLETWLAAGAPDGSAREAALECLAEWARRDAQAALQFVHDAPAFPGRNEACALPLACIGREDMPAAIAWLRANLPEYDWAYVAQDVIAHLAHDAPQQAAELALADGIAAGPHYFGEIIKSLMRTSPDEALALFERLPESGKNRAAVDFVSAWLQTDPASALAWCERHRDAPFAELLKRGLLRDLMGTSSPHLEAMLDRLRLTPRQMDWDWGNYCQRFPDKALARLQALPDEISSASAGPLAKALLSTGSPDEALEVLKLCLPPGEVGPALYDSWNIWARSDRKAAEAWLETVPDAEIRGQLRNRARAEDNPVEFLQTAGADADPEAVYQAGANIAIYKENADMGVWLDFLGRNPGYFQDGRVRHMVGWLVMNGVEPPAMLAVIEQIPPGLARDRALASAAAAWAGKGDTSLAASLASAIDDPDTRAAQLFGVYGEMRRRDPAAASGWLAAQPLPPEVRASWEAIAKAPEW
jgi:hypothetical protein